LAASRESTRASEGIYDYLIGQDALLESIVTFQWNAANRLTTVTRGRQITKITYDGLDRFVRITDTGTATNSDVRYLWDGDQIVAQLDSTGTTVLKRYFALRRASWDNELLLQGTLTGASVGAEIGGTAGTLLGGVGGTLLEPGGGTIVGGIKDTHFNLSIIPDQISL